MPTQIEQIEWHDARKDIPPDGWILVDTAPDHDIDMMFIRAADTMNKLHWDGIVAWAEMPKGWIE
jgi:hypothetical protein